MDLIRSLLRHNIHSIFVEPEFKYNQVHSSTQTFAESTRNSLNLQNEFSFNENIQDSTNYTMRLYNPTKEHTLVGEEEYVTEMIVLDTLRTNTMEFYNKVLNYNTIIIDVSDDTELLINTKLAGIFIINNVDITKKVTVTVNFSGKNDAFILLKNTNIILIYNNTIFKTIMSQIIRIIFSNFEQKYYIEHEESLVSNTSLNDINSNVRLGFKLINVSDNSISLDVDTVIHYELNISNDLEIQLIGQYGHEGIILFHNISSSIVSIQYGSKIYSALDNETYIAKYKDNNILYFQRIPYRLSNSLNILTNLFNDNISISFDVFGVDYQLLIINLVDNNKDIAYKVIYSNQRHININLNEFILYMNDNILIGKYYDLSVDIFHKSNNHKFNHRISQKFTFSQKVIFNQ